MVVLDRFYQIVESDTAKVSIFWKVAHVLAFIGAAVCGFLTAFSFGEVLDDFNYNCVLNAKLAFDNNTNLVVGNQTYSIKAIDLTKTNWGTSSECYFAQFTPLFTMISAVIWGTFFIIIARGGGGYQSDLLSRPWGIIYPCIFFTIITFIVYLTSTLKLRRGLSAFCEEFKSQFNNAQCSDKINIYSVQFHESKERGPFESFYINQTIAVMSSEIGIWIWIAQLCLLIARVILIVDFDLRLVTILPKEEELVEKITEPDMDDETSEV